MILTCIRNINNFIKIKLIVDRDNNLSLLINLETITGFDEIIKKIDEIMSQHRNERGLILTSSEKKCLDIKNFISELLDQQSKDSVKESLNKCANSIGAWREKYPVGTKATNESQDDLIATLQSCKF